MKALIIGKKIVGRKETLEYAANKYNWQNVIIGISHLHGLIAWFLSVILRKKFIYYCIDFYTYQIRQSFIDGFYIWRDMQIDKFLCRRAYTVWDISTRINEGRIEFGKYSTESQIIPLSYPPNYFRFTTHVVKNRIAFVGLVPYGLELLEGIKGIDLYWLGKDKLLPLEKLLKNLSLCGIGISLWEKNGNNYYGDPGKTKLYSACGLPVIMTINTPYAKVIMKTGAGIIVDYNRDNLTWAIKQILSNYDFFKYNVSKTWKYINADEIFRDRNILE